jgi:anti-anti-sigma regulatory factor
MNANATIAIGTSVIRSDTAGFARLGRLFEELSAHRNSKIKIDLSRVAWLDAHMAAPLLIVIRRAGTRGNTFEFINAQPDVALTLRKNRFFARVATDTYRTTMPTTEFDLTEGKKFSLYAKEHLNRKEVPDMSPALRGKFFEGVDELFANSALHSNAKINVVVCGQFYPRNRRLDFTLADGGRTIAGALRDSKIGPYTDERAIAWAMEPYNTTRQGDIPGGLGSKILREFIELNGGKLIVVSRAGFWCQKGTKVIYSSLPHAFPGTAVILEINTADDNKYDLVNPPSPKDIW